MANVSLNVIASGALRGMYQIFGSFILVWLPYLTYIISYITTANIVLADLTRNNLTQFESAVFQTMLQGMITLNGSLIIDSSACYIKCILCYLLVIVRYSLFINFLFFILIEPDPFECDCNLAWLIRDNRNLLPVVHGAQCSNSTRFEQLDPSGFSDCVLSL